MDDELMAKSEELKKEIAELKQLLEILSAAQHKSEWISSFEVLQFLNISRLTLKRFRETKKIRTICLRGRYRYNKLDIKKLIENDIK